MPTSGGRLKYVAESMALAIVYVAAARAGLMLDAVAGSATLVWAPTGIALAALLIGGFRLWPGILAGVLATNLLTGAPIPVAVGIGAGNTLEALAGAYALTRIPGFRRSLDRLVDVLGLIVFAALLSTALSATIGVSSLYLGGIVPLARFGETWRAWWLGDLIGALLVAPVVLAWSIMPRAVARDRILEAGALSLSLAAVSLIVFSAHAGDNHGALGEAYLFFPIIIWAAVRFGQRGSVSTTFLISVIAVGATVLGHGPFVQPQLHQSLIALQTFMAITAATFLVLGASISERDAATAHLQKAITDQQRLMAERDASHQRLITVLEQAPMAISIVEAPDGNVLFVNDEVERLTGRGPALSMSANIVGIRLAGSRPDGTPVKPDEWPIVRALRHGEIVRNEVIRLERDDGHVLEITTNAAPVRNADGQIIAAVVIFWDVTAQRRAEEDLRRAHAAAAKANRAKSDFLAVMSHELRTPLNAIGGHIQLIEMEVLGPINEVQRDALKRVQRNQRHLLSLINDLLNLARIEAGHVEYELADVPVDPLLAEVVAMVEPLFSSNELVCEVIDSPYAPDPSLLVRADRDKLQQILFNVLSNAIKFTPSGGRIAIESHICNDAPQMAAIVISDSGAGIPAAKLESIFEPFVQLGTAPANPSVGLGLGLAISRDLARGMGGDLTAASTVGEGATFTLSLPRAQTITSP